MGETLETSFFRDVIESSWSEETKMNELLSRFRSAVKDNIDEDFDVILYGMLKFFSKSFYLNNDYMVNGLNEYFDIVNENWEKIFNVLPIDKYLTHLETLRKKLLFRKSSSYWQFLYKMEKEEDLSSIEFQERLKTNYNEERPALTQKLGILQEAHDFFERHKCCKENHEFLYFYLQALISKANSMVIQEMYRDNFPFSFFLKNIKNEIARLLKCLFAMKLHTHPCDHAAFKSRGIKIDCVLANNILVFYLTHASDEVAYEMCRQMKHVFENGLKSDIKQTFYEHLSNIQKFEPICQMSDDDEMDDLDSNFCDVKAANFAYAQQFDKKEHLIRAKLFYFLSQFNNIEKEDVVCLGLKLLSFKNNIVLYEKSSAHIWFIIGKCLFNSSDIEIDQCKKIIFSFHLSLFFDKEKAETHILLAIALHRLYLNTQLTTHLEHLKMHIKFASKYIQKETKIDRVAKIVNDFLTTTQRNQIDVTNDDIKSFIKISTNHFVKLIKGEIGNTNNHSANFIKRTHNLLLELFEILNSQGYKSIVPCDDINLLIGDLNKSLENKSTAGTTNLRFIELNEDGEFLEYGKHRKINHVIDNKIENLKFKLEMEKQKLSQFKQKVSDSENNIFELRLEIANMERDTKFKKLEIKLESSEKKQSEMLEENYKLIEENEQLTNEIKQIREVIEKDEEEENNRMARERHQLDEENKRVEAKRKRLESILGKRHHNDIA